MIEKSAPQEREKKKGTTHQSRWSRDAKGTLRYRGVCPFNRAVCKLVNVISHMKARHVEG